MKRKRPSAAARSGGAAKKSLVVQVTNGLKSRVGSWIQGIFRQDNDSESRVTWSDDSGSSCEEAEEVPSAGRDPLGRNPDPPGGSGSPPAQTNAHGAGLTAEHRAPLGNDRPEHRSFRDGFAIGGPASPAQARLQKPPPAPGRPRKDVATQYEEDDDMSSTSGFSSRHSDRDTVISWTQKCEEAQRPGTSMMSASDTSRRKDSAVVHLSSKRLANECSDKRNASCKRTRAACDDTLSAFPSACAPAELTKTSSVRPGRSEAAPYDAAQQTVRELLRSLETMSSPLADAKKIPLTASCIQMKNDRKHQSETPPASSPFKRLRIDGVACSPAEHARMGRKALRSSETLEETQAERAAERTPKRGAHSSASSTPSASSPGTLGRFCRPPLCRAGKAAPRGEHRTATREPSKQATSKSPPAVVAEAKARKEEQSERGKRTPEQRRSGHFTAFLADEVNDLDDIEMEPPSNSQAFKNIDKGYMSGSSSTSSSSSSTPTKGLVNNASTSTLVPPSGSPTSSRLSEDAANGGAEGGDPPCPAADESKGKSSSEGGRAAGGKGTGAGGGAWECDTCLVWNAGRRRRCVACDVPLPSVLALRSMLVPRPSAGDAAGKETGAAGQRGSADRPDGTASPGTGLDSNAGGDETNAEAAARDAARADAIASPAPAAIPPSSLATSQPAGVPAAGGARLDAGAAGSPAAAPSQSRAPGIVDPGAGAAAPAHGDHLSEPPSVGPAGRYCSDCKRFTVPDAGSPFQFGIGGGGEQPQPTTTLVAGLTAVATEPESGEAADQRAGDSAGKHTEPPAAASGAGKQTPQFSFGSSGSGFKIDFSGLQQQGLGLSAGFRFGGATAAGNDPADGTLGNAAPASSTAAPPGTTSLGGGGTQPNSTAGHQLALYPVSSGVTLPGSAPATNPSLAGPSVQLAPSTAGIAAATATATALASMPAPQATSSAASSVSAPSAPGAGGGIAAPAPASSPFPFTFGSFAATGGKADPAAGGANPAAAPSSAAASGSLFAFANTAAANPGGGASAAPAFVVGNPAGALGGGSGSNPAFSAAPSAGGASKLSFAFGNPALPTTGGTAVVAPTVAFGGSASAPPPAASTQAAAASGAGNPFVFGVASSGGGAGATAVPTFAFGKSAAAAASLVPASAAAGLAAPGNGGPAAAPALTFGQTAAAPPVAATGGAASPFAFKGGAANAAAAPPPLFNFGAIRTSGVLASSNPSIFTFGGSGGAVKTSATVAQAPIFSFGGATPAAGALAANAPPQGAAAGGTIQPFQFGAASAAAAGTGTGGGNFPFGGAPPATAPAPTFTKPEAPASVFKFGTSGAVGSGAAQPAAGFAFGATVPSAASAAPAAQAAPTLSFGLQGAGKPDAAAGFAFGAAAPAPAPAPSAVPLFNFANSESGNNSSNADFRPTPTLQPSELSRPVSRVSDKRPIRRLCLGAPLTPRRYSGKRPIRHRPLGRQPIKGWPLDNRPTNPQCLGKRLIRLQRLAPLRLRSARRPIKTQRLRHSLDSRPIHPLPSMQLLPTTTALRRSRLERTSLRRSPSPHRVVPRSPSDRREATGETHTGASARLGAGATRTSRRSSTESGTRHAGGGVTHAAPDRGAVHRSLLDSVREATDRSCKATRPLGRQVVCP